MLRFLADGSLILILAIAGIAGLVWLWRERPRLQSWAPYVVMAGLTSLLTGKLMSFWQPSEVRPFVERGLEAGAAYIDNPGFPSDHALFAMFLALAVWYGSRNRRLGLVLIGLTLVVCLGRVLALVHTPLDVVGGILVACVGALWYLADKTTNTSSKTRKKVVQ